MSILSMIPAAVSVGSAIYGAIRGKKAASKQFERQKELQEHAKNQQLDIWKKTNYPEQKKQMEEAGLNPGLLYGMGGTGGATTGSVGAGQAVQENVYDIGQGINRALAAAQIEATKAQTEKTKAEAEKIKGVDTEQTTADTELSKAKTEFQKLESELAGKSLTAKLNIYEEQANKLAYEAVQQSVEAGVSADTAEDRVKIIAHEAINAMLNNQLTAEKINEIIAAIEQRYEQNRLQGLSIQQSKENTETIAEAMLWGAGIHAAGSVINHVIDVATLPKTLTKETVREVTTKSKKQITKDITKERSR